MAATTTAVASPDSTSQEAQELPEHTYDEPRTYTHGSQQWILRKSKVQLHSLEYPERLEAVEKVFHRLQAQRITRAAAAAQIATVDAAATADAAVDKGAIATAVAPCQVLALNSVGIIQDSE